jgi:succinate dehydrogenase / fumarate reductase flavoprotein subunit
VVFTRAMQDMFPVAKLILKGALLRDECRGAHFKPEFAMPGLEPTTDPAERRRAAEAWCDRFEENTRRWLKSTIAADKSGEPEITYEAVDTSLIPPRPRMYGLVGAEAIEEVWKSRAAAKTSTDGVAKSAGKPALAAAR